METDIVSNWNNTKAYKTIGHTTCQTHNLVYAVICKKCGTKYI